MWGDIGIFTGKTRGKRVEEKKKKKAGSEKPETAPELVVKPRRQFVDHGGDAKFKASFDGSENTTLSWSKDGKTLSASDDTRYKMYEQDGFHFLEVTSVTMDDMGVYTVTVENSVGSDKASADLDVFEKPQLLSRESEPSWEKSLKDTKAHQDDDMVELVCVSKDLLKPSVQWYHDGKEVVSGSHMKIHHEGQRSSLVIKGVKDTDGGQYKCVVTGSNGKLESSCKLAVAPAEKPSPPVFVKELHDMEVEDGDKLELVVEVKGTPPVQVFWFHNNEEITLTNPHFLLASLGNVHTLTLPHATTQCAGQLVCEAYNDCGDTDTFCVIDVKELENPELPHFVMRPCNCTVEEGDDATFVCKMRGQPMPTVVWEREGVEITESSKYKMGNMKELHSLTIYNVDPLDKGEYTCHLHNTQGNTSHTFQLFLMSDIIVTSKPGRPHHTNPISFSIVKKEPLTGSQTERFERTEATERPTYSLSFMQPKISADTIVRSSSARANFETPAPSVPETNESNDALHDSPLFKRAREKLNTKGQRSYDNFAVGNSVGKSDNTFFGSGTVDFREKDRDSSLKEPGKFRSALTAREITGSKQVVENGLVNLQVERDFRNVLSRGNGNYKSGLCSSSSWKTSNGLQGGLTSRDSSYQRNGNKAMSSIGLKVVNRSLGSLGQQNNVFQNSIGSSSSSLEKPSQTSEPTYSPSSSLQFESGEIRKITNSVLNSDNRHSRESMDNAKNVIGDNLHRAEKRPTNMFEPTERPFSSQTIAQPVLHHARLTTLKKPNNVATTTSSSASSSLHSSTPDTYSTNPSQPSSTTTTSHNVKGIPSIQINTSLKINSSLTPKISERINKLERDPTVLENKSNELRSHSRLKGCSEMKSNNNQNDRLPTSSTHSSNLSNVKAVSTTNQKESGSVFTWGKRPSKTKEEIIEDTRLVVSNAEKPNHTPLSSVAKGSTKNPADLSVHDSTPPHRILSNKSDISVSSSKTTPSTSSSSAQPEFRSIKLKPTQKKDEGRSSTSEQLKKSKFLSKSTENVFGDVKLRPVSKANARPNSEFNQQNVGRLRLKSKSTNFSDINLVSDSDDPEKEKEKDIKTEPNQNATTSHGVGTKLEKTRTDVFLENKVETTEESKPILKVDTTDRNTNYVRENRTAPFENVEAKKPTKGVVTIETKTEESRGTYNKPDTSKKSDFMEKIRKWKTADFTEKVNKMNSGAQTSRVTESGSQNSPLASTMHRNSIPKTAGSSYLDSVPEWVKQKALNKRNSLQTDKPLMPSTNYGEFESNPNLSQTYRASLINAGDFTSAQRKAADSLNKTFHNFDRNTGLKPEKEKESKDNEPEENSKPSTVEKPDSMKRNEKLVISSRLGIQRSAPDLKDKTKFENDSTQHELDWLHRKPIRNIEQMIKASSQNRVDKISKDDEKPEWVKLKSPKDIKHGGQTLFEEKINTSFSASNSRSSSSKSDALENDKKYSRNSELPITDSNETRVLNKTVENVSKTITRDDLILSTKPKLDQEKDSFEDSSKYSGQSSTNESENKAIVKDQDKESFEKSNPVKEEERFSDQSKSIYSSHDHEQPQIPCTNGQIESQEHPECKTVFTPPTPGFTDEPIPLVANTAKEHLQEIKSQNQSSSSSTSSSDRQPLAKSLHLQKQAQPSDQPPLKNAPVRPIWMKQKSLRHIPIYPIHDNELSPRYEPFRKSMDDTSSTNSVSSLASDASGLTTDSGYGKSVLLEDVMNNSKDTLLDRGTMDNMESEDISHVVDHHNKSGSNDNVFKLADTDSGFCTETDAKSCNTSRYREEKRKDLIINNKPQPSKTTENQSVNSNTIQKEPLKYECVQDVSKASDKVSSGNKISERLSKYETGNEKQTGSAIISKDTTGASTTRTPKSEFLKKRLSLTPQEDTNKDLLSSSSTHQSTTRIPAIRPTELNISPNTGRRNKSSLLNNTTKYNSHITNSCINPAEEPKPTNHLEKNDSSFHSRIKLNGVSSFSKNILPKDVDKKNKEPSLSDHGGIESTGSKLSTNISKHTIQNENVSDDAETSPLTTPTPEETCPRFDLPLNDIAVTYGSKATLRCHVTGVPMPEIQWLCDRKPIQQSKEISISFSDSTGVCTLIVQETFTDHIGTYSCLASNSAGSVTTSARLSLATSKKSEGLAIEGPVALPPRAVSLSPKALTLSRDSTLTLTLNFLGEPTPTVTWKQGQKELVHGDGRVSIVTSKGTSVLTIDHVTGMDTGKMTAVLTNSIGSDYTSANVCIEDIPGQPVGKPHVYGINRESASLSWCGPSSSGGSTINYYVIEAKTRQQPAWDVLVPQCKELSYHVFGLVPSSTYQFRVRAANKQGLGPPSEPSERVITSDPFSGSLDESDGCPDVFTPSVEYRRPDELPFDPRNVELNKSEKFEDQYDLGPVVGKGKFGVVYKCTQKEDSQNRTWAAKVIKCREKDKAAIRQEVEVMNRLRHPKLLMLWDAFESPRQMVLVMEFIGAGELFERVIGEDFVLTERDCVHFLRQICEGVSYMHSTHVLHLDLKPENILCIAENSNRIKIIDFGLARIFNKGDSIKVLLGTPEFIAPEVINYDEISFSTDMWSIGVICYVLLSGLSPFLGDNDAETLSNVTIGEFDFDDEAFDEISDEAKDFISKLLIKRKEKRMLTEDCLKHPWLAGDEVDGMRYKRLNTDRLKHFMVRRKWLKTGNAVLAVSRLMKTTSLGSFTNRSDSSSSLNNSNVTTPRSPTGDDVVLSETSQSPPLPQNGSDIDQNTQKSTDLDKNDILILKDQNDNKLPTGEVITSVVNKDGINSDCVPLHECSPNGVTSSNCENRHNGDVSASSDSQESQQELSSTGVVQENASTSSSTASSSTLCSSSTTSTSTSQSSSSQQPPSFTRQMADSKAFVGDHVRFDVVLEGSPFPNVEWYFEEERLSCHGGNDSKYSIESNQSKGTSSLIIRSVEEDDDGEYICKAINSSGELVCSAELSVLEM